MKTAYGPKDRVSISFPEVGRTKQSMVAECDINNIMQRFIKTGIIEHGNKHGARYGFATSLDFREACDLIENAQHMFQDLPGKVRAKFDNDPARFLDFVQDPANAGKLKDVLEPAAPITASGAPPPIMVEHPPQQPPQPSPPPSS